eukprot:3459816-Alexandrium_andersonii.AAC.1
MTCHFATALGLDLSMWNDDKEINEFVAQLVADDERRPADFMHRWRQHREGRSNRTREDLRRGQVFQAAQKRRESSKARSMGRGGGAAKAAAAPATGAAARAKP